MVRIIYWLISVFNLQFCIKINWHNAHLFSFHLLLVFFYVYLLFLFLCFYNAISLSWANDDLLSVLWLILLTKHKGQNFPILRIVYVSIVSNPTGILHWSPWQLPARVFSFLQVAVVVCVAHKKIGWMTCYFFIRV